MIPLYKPFMPEVPLLIDILQSGNLAYGSYGKEFEKKLKEYIGTDNLITTNTFNMAILVALTTLGIKSGDMVIASPMACLSSTQPLVSFGIKILWADVDPTTGTLSPDSVQKLVTKKPKAIIHNHFCGFVGFVDEINEIGKKSNIYVIDDCIEAFGSEYKGRKMGNVGTDVTIFSFGPVRNPNTLDGGAVIIKDANLYKNSQLVRDAGIDRQYFRDSSGEIDPNYDIKLIGHSATMSEVNSYIGIQQMKNIERIIDKQRNNSLKWDSLELSKFGLKPIVNNFALPNYWVYGVIAENKKDAILKLREKGYFASGVHINNNRYSVFEDNSFLPGVDLFYNSFVALPSGWWVDNICL